MLDFLKILTRRGKNGVIEIYPDFDLIENSDIMIRGGDFYAVWLEKKNLWSTEEKDVIRLVDRELDKFAEENREKYETPPKVLHMRASRTGMIDQWHKYCKQQMRDSYHPLDEKLIFSNMETKKEDYASKKLNYPLEEGSIEAWDKLVSTLYSEEERRKIEWAIGSIVNGDSKKNQKFMVLYGAAGTGKSTIFNIIQKLFDGYYSVFDAKALGSANESFALEAFVKNPLVAIQHDGDLSRIEDNTRLNSVVSHELMTVNVKHKSVYSDSFKSFLFMGTNKPVKITDAKSGLLRRLIDVSPTGNKITYSEYCSLTKQIDFELGAIAYHCLQVYNEDPSYYDNYVPLRMMGASNDFYNFMLDSYYVFEEADGTSLKAAWEMYGQYCTEAKVAYPLSQRAFREELRNYFKEYKDRATMPDGSRPRNYYSGFRTDKFEEFKRVKPVVEADPTWLEFKEQKSVFDKECGDCLAQLATSKETPSKKWDDVTTTLSEINTKELHYVRVPENHIVIDFDIPDESGNKCFAKNLEAASKWPKTYAELSKSGEGIHLHYIYTGDPKKLSRIYDDHVEVKVFTGKSSLRRKLTKCNDLNIAPISSGLPLKGDTKLVNLNEIKNEKILRALVKKSLNREIHANTKPNVDFIYKILEDAYSNGIVYDLQDLRGPVLSFAAGSTHQADYCIKLVNKMKFKSEADPSGVDSKKTNLVFFDCEVFPNLFLINWKIAGEGNPVVRMINPTPDEVRILCDYRLVGFNCRRYDNHILYARGFLNYTNEQLYELSKKIVNGEPNCFFGQAYNLSYCDVFDFSSKKQSLKKFEVELGIMHKELGIPWDQPVPEEKWEEVAAYCDNDVIATEATFNARQADFTAREILAEVAGMSVNDTTNSLTTRIIFGKDRTPQGQFNYRDMGDISTVEPDLDFDEYTKLTKDGKPVFPGYTFDHGVSTYRGEEVGEGGYVYAEPGMYTDVALLDIASMHPSSIVAEELFGEQYTSRFKEILDARIAIKHGDFDKAKTMLGGVLAKYLVDENSAKDLAQALKIAINSVYGLTSAKFDNPFRDKRNKDNIVAKRGALFMINLKHEVQARGFTVAHIKTDSIKIPNATQEIIDFVMEYGKMYGYNFEHEATYERMCLVNDAVYIAKYKDGKHAGEWTATGKQFQVPYVFKKLFSKEEIEFKDLCETMSATSALYLDMNEPLPEGEHAYVFVGKVGQFCPVKPGCNGGILLRESENKKTGEKKYDAAAGTKGYRWLESVVVKELNKIDDIDLNYYNNLVDAAVENISQYGDFEQFIS